MNVRTLLSGYLLITKKPYGWSTIGVCIVFIANSSTNSDKGNVIDVTTVMNLIVSFCCGQEGIVRLSQFFGQFMAIDHSIAHHDEIFLDISHRGT